MGFRSKVARTTLADANERRDWRTYADFAQILIGTARPLYAKDPMAGFTFVNDGAGNCWLDPCKEFNDLSE